MMVTGSLVWLDAADLGEIQAQLSGRGETHPLSLGLPASTPVDQGPPKSQKRCGVLDHNRGCRQSPGKHDIVSSHTLLPHLSASANHVRVGDLSASNESFHEHALTALRLNQADLRSWERNRQSQPWKASTRTKIRDPLRRGERLHPQSNKRVGEVNIRRTQGITYRRRGSLVCRQLEQDRLQLGPLALTQVVALGEAVELGGSGSGESLSFHVKQQSVEWSQAGSRSSKHVPGAQALLPQRRNHQIPLGLLALAVSTHIPAVA